MMYAGKGGRAHKTHVFQLGERGKCSELLVFLRTHLWSKDCDAMAGSGASCTSVGMLQLVLTNFALLSVEQGTHILHKYKEEEKSFLLS